MPSKSMTILSAIAGDLGTCADRRRGAEMMAMLVQLARAKRPRHSGPRPIRRAFGKHRAIFVCSSCRGDAIRYSGNTAHRPAATAQRARYLPPRQSSQGRKRLAAISTSQLLKNETGNTESGTKHFAIKFKHSKPRRSKHGSAKKSIFVPSLIRSDSCAVLEFPRIEPSLGLNQGNQQSFIRTAFGPPTEVRYVPSGP
jgi:hypothetical protein